MRTMTQKTEVIGLGFDITNNIVDRELEIVIQKINKLVSLKKHNLKKHNLSLKNDNSNELVFYIRNYLKDFYNDKLDNRDKDKAYEELLYAVSYQLSLKIGDPKKLKYNEIIIIKNSFIFIVNYCVNYEILKTLSKTQNLQKKELFFVSSSEEDLSKNIPSLVQEKGLFAL